ncbi:MAG: hypothetical protein ACE5HO_15470 [bacterium]
MGNKGLQMSAFAGMTARTWVAEITWSEPPQHGQLFALGARVLA